MEYIAELLLATSLLIYVIGLMGRESLHISVTCAPPWVLYALLEGPLSVAVRLLPLVSVEHSLM